MFLRQLDGRDSLKTLTKLFAFQAPVAEDEARAALAPLELEHCAALGLLHLESGEVVSQINISVCDDLFIAHDPSGVESLRGMHPDHVLGISPPTLLLARLTPRSHFTRALDLGSGCGVQALIAARHCQSVIATDLNARALNFARFNAALNGFENIDFRLGSLFQPVEGEQFDLIVSNPPYVISPETNLLFRDGGKSADTFCEHLVRALPNHLLESGFACMLANWAHSTDEHWSAPIRRWVHDSACDCWALHGREHDPVSYAADWNRYSSPQQYQRALDEWPAYYEKLGIKSISSGGMVLRRRSNSQNWFRADELGEGITPLGPEIPRVFAAEDFLAATSDQELLATAFLPQQTHKLIQVIAPNESGYNVESMRLESSRQPPFVASMDAHTLHLLRGCNGQKTLKDLLIEVAALTKSNPLACESRGLKIIRGLIAHDVLAPNPRVNSQQEL